MEVPTPSSIAPPLVDISGDSVACGSSQANESLRSREQQCEQQQAVDYQRTTKGENDDASLRRSIVERQSPKVDLTVAALLKIRSIMCGLREQRWIPSYVPYLSDRMIFELCWPSSITPRASELKSIPLETPLETFLRQIEPLLGQRRRHRDSISTVDESSPENGKTQPLTLFEFCQGSLALRFDDPQTEQEFCVFLYKNRMRGAVISICSALVIVVNILRLRGYYFQAPSETTEESSSMLPVALMFVTIIGFVILAVVFVGFSRLVRLHDAGIRQMSRSHLRLMASIQEVVIFVICVICLSFVGEALVTESQCPTETSIDGKVLFCRATVGSPVVGFIIILALPVLAFPTRFATLSILHVILFCEFLTFYGLVHVNDERSTMYAQGRIWTSHSQFFCRVILCFVMSCWLLYFRWQSEQLERLEFNMACRLEATSLELVSLQQGLAYQFTAAVPTFVARCLIDGRAVHQHNDRTVILTSGIVDYNSLTRHDGPAGIVTRLNKVFFLLDQSVRGNTVGIQKMQTLGDAYTCVFGLHRQHVPGEPLNCASALLPMRNLAVRMLLVTTGVAPLAVALHVGQASGVVLGKSLAYVAVGSGIRACSQLMRNARKHGIVTSPAFDDAVSDAASRRSINSPISASMHGTQSHHQDDTDKVELREDEVSILRKMWCRPSSLVDDSGDSSVNRSYEIDGTLFTPVFRDTLLEQEYIDSVDRNGSFQAMTDIGGGGYRTVYVGIVTICMVNVVLFQLVDAPYLDESEVIDNTIAVGLWLGCIVLSIVGYAVEKVQMGNACTAHTSPKLLWFRRSALLIIVVMHHTAYALLSTCTFVLHSAVAATSLICMVALSRVSTWPLFAFLQDLVLLFVPMFLVQLRLLADADTSGPPPHPSASTANSPSHETFYITSSEKQAELIAWLFVLCVYLLADIVYRVFSDLDRRSHFATHHSLAVESVHLQSQQINMASYIDTVVPKFAAEKFQEFIVQSAMMSETAAHCMSDAVHPWHGNWFATRVVDLPLLVVHVGDFDTPKFQFESQQSSCASRSGPLSSSSLPTQRFASSASATSVVSEDVVVCSSEHAMFVKLLEVAHAMLDRVLASEPFLTTVCKAKSAGDSLMLTASCIDESPLRAIHLVEFAAEVLRAFSPHGIVPKMVLNCGLVVGALIGTDRLTFELYGEAVSTSIELLQAMPYHGCIITDRVYQQVSTLLGRFGHISMSRSEIWGIRGAQKLVRVHRMLLD